MGKRWVALVEERLKGGLSPTMVAVREGKKFSTRASKTTCEGACAPLRDKRLQPAADFLDVGARIERGDAEIAFTRRTKA